MEKLGEIGTNAYVLSGTLWLREGTVYVHKSSALSEQARIHNPHIAFWRRSVWYYAVLERAIQEADYRPFIEDYALIISDLGMCLTILFGRNWTKNLKEQYEHKTGKTLKKTPRLIPLLRDFYPKANEDWDIKKEKPLYKALTDFIGKFYNDIVKHFEAEKFEKALEIDLNRLTHFMEITRQAWFWLMKKKHNKVFAEGSCDPYFKDFTRTYDPNWKAEYV